MGTAAGMSALLVLLLPQKPPLARLPHHRPVLTVARVQLSPPVSAGRVRHADLGGERKGKRAAVGPGHPCALRGDVSALPLLPLKFSMAAARPPLGAGGTAGQWQCGGRGPGCFPVPQMRQKYVTKEKKKHQTTLSLGALANSKRARPGARAGLTGMSGNWKLRARNQLGLSQRDL